MSFSGELIIRYLSVGNRALFEYYERFFVLVINERVNVSV